MGDIPAGWALVIAAAITALLALIGTLLTLVLRQTKRTHWQVANNHVDDEGNPINLRDDLDELALLVKGVAASQVEQAKDIGGMRVDIRQIRTDQTEDRRTATRAAEVAAKAARDAIRALERTHPTST